MVFQRAYVRAMGLVPGYRWWRPLVALVLAVVLLLLFAFLFALPFFFYFHLVRDGGVPDALGIQETFEGLRAGGNGALLARNPLSLLFRVGTVILMIPAIALALRLAKLKGLGTLSSVDGHLRWDRLGTYLAPAFASVFVIGFALPWVLRLAGGAGWELPHPRVIPLALVAILVLVPLQSLAEEYAFRGLLMQVPGSWISAVWVPVLIQSLLFAAGHRYSLAEQLGVAGMGLVMGSLTVRLGGLEAAIALHCANNLLWLLSGSLFIDDSTPNTANTIDPALRLAFCLVYALIALRIAKRRGWLASDPPDLDERLALAAGRPVQASGGFSTPPESQGVPAEDGGAEVDRDVSQPSRSLGTTTQDPATPPDPSGHDVPGVSADIEPHEDLP